jgi:hypothetical protein
MIRSAFHPPLRTLQQLAAAALISKTVRCDHGTCFTPNRQGPKHLNGPKTDQKNDEASRILRIS